MIRSGEVSRPSRLQAPSPSERFVDRPRLTSKLAARRANRVITVVAGPGFGKTQLLVAAMNELADDQSIHDVWLSCEPADEFEGHLLAGLAEALGVPNASGIEDVFDAVWAQAPIDVCIVLDDVHEIPSDSPGAMLLGRLIDELPRNGHLLLASRDVVPVRVARLAAGGRLLRITEPDLVFSDAELAAFARLCGLSDGMLSSTGGWPALAELTASTGPDLVLDYLWDEVIGRLGTVRSLLLAKFAVTGGGDDAVVTALAGHASTVDELVASLPLVKRSTDGWAELHPLWEPALRRLLDQSSTAEAHCRAADAHLAAGRTGMAVGLLVETEAWDEVLELLRSVLVHAPAEIGAADIGRWYRTLPKDWRQHPVALLAAGTDIQARSPIEAVPAFAAAAAAFRAREDVDGELASLEREGLVRWWTNDFAGLWAINLRATDLAAGGSKRAGAVAAVGTAAVAHLTGDSTGVLAALADVGPEAAGWLPQVHWLRSVAHRRNGDLLHARAELAAASLLSHGLPDPQRELAVLRIDWLDGRVDHVRARLPEFHRRYEQLGDLFLAKEIGLELACKAAWLGELPLARELITSFDDVLTEMPGQLATALKQIATAALAVGEGDERQAAAVVRSAAAGLSGPDAWYWRDRAAHSLVHVLVPELRPIIEAQVCGPAHIPGLVLAAALEATRDGDLSVVRAMSWPPAGVVRAYLPSIWAIELAAAGRAADNPAPLGVLVSTDPRLRSGLRGVVIRAATPEIKVAAQQLLAELPGVPLFHLRIDIIGPLQVLRDGRAHTSPDVRRKRVQELLCYLVAFRRVRREAVSDALWPDVLDGGRNLRVTLSYLQKVLQPDRADGEAPYFLRSESGWLIFEPDLRVTVDFWEMESCLDVAAAAERDGSPAAALAAYRQALSLWRGDPFADLPDAGWAQATSVRIRQRYVVAAVRAGELLLAAGDANGARDAAERAVAAEPSAEPAYFLLMRAHVAAGDARSASHVADAYRAALADLNLQPTPASIARLTPV